MFVYPRIHSLCLPLGSNSLFAVCCAFVYPHIHPFVCFLGLTPFLQVFCVCTPTCAFLYLFFGSNSLLEDFVAPVLEVFRSISLARSALRILYLFGSFY